MAKFLRPEQSSRDGNVMQSRSEKEAGIGKVNTTQTSCLFAHIFPENTEIYAFRHLIYALLHIPDIVCHHVDVNGRTDTAHTTPHKRSCGYR